MKEPLKDPKLPQEGSTLNPKPYITSGGLYGYWCGGWRFADSPVPGLEVGPAWMWHFLVSGFRV